MPNSSKSMPLDIFKKIVQKAKSENYDIIGLYDWTEPFLAKNLPDYLRIIKEFGLLCTVSSNMSFNDKLDIIEKSLPYIDLLTISVSGYNQGVYETNHRGGRTDYVKANLEYISKLHHNTVVLRFIKFDYNAQEEPLFRDYAKSLAIDFEVLEGSGNPLDPDTQIGDSEESFLNRLSAPKVYYEEVCPLIMDMIGIDCNGDVYLCCSVPNYPCLRIGAYLDMNYEDLLKYRYIHPICNSCTWVKRRKMTENEHKVLEKALKPGEEEIKKKGWWRFWR
jgi:hypothetical protein